MDPIKIDGLLQKKISSKGNEYYCIEFNLTPTYKAVYFPTSAEVELIKANNKNTDSTSNVFESFK